MSDAHLTHGATDRLSRCASALLLLAEAFEASYEDLVAFSAPSECGADVARHHRTATRAALAARGYTVDGFEDEFASRVSGRAAYDMLGSMCLPDGEDVGDPSAVAATRRLMRESGERTPDYVEVIQDSHADVYAVQATWGNRTEPYHGRTAQYLLHACFRGDQDHELEEVDFGCWPPTVSA